jgi:Adenylate kinase
MCSRRIGQAEALDRRLAARGTALDAACYLEVPDEELRRRLGARGRVDDDERVIGHRLAVFRTQTRPLLAYYQDRGRLVVIDAVGPVEMATGRILDTVCPRLPTTIRSPFRLAAVASSSAAGSPVLTWNVHFTLSWSSTSAACARIWSSIACQPAASSPGSACIGDHDRAEFISWSRARPQAAL